MNLGRLNPEPVFISLWIVGIPWIKKKNALLVISGTKNNFVAEGKNILDLKVNQGRCMRGGEHTIETKVFNQNSTSFLYFSLYLLYLRCTPANLRPRSLRNVDLWSVLNSVL